LGRKLPCKKANQFSEKTLTKSIIMGEETIEEKETPEENQEGKEIPETPAEKTEDKSKELQSALAQKEHFREKVDKLEKELEKFKPKEHKQEPKEEVWEATGDPMESVRLGKSLKDFSEEETEFIIRNAPTKNVEGIIKASKDEWVLAAIEKQREKVAAENKTPAPSSPSPSNTYKTAEEAVKEGEEKELEDIKNRVEKLEKEEEGAGI
jgi:hypothetical protein